MSVTIYTRYTRPTWDEYWLEVMEATAKRATCDRGRSGCVIVRDNRLLASGYVGSPSGFPHCDTVGHLFREVTNGDPPVTKQHCVRTIHAEMNAILQAAKNGISLDGATLYCRMTPCRNCAMAIIQVGIIRVVAQTIYQAAEDAIEMFGHVGIRLEHKCDEIQKY